MIYFNFIDDVNTGRSYTDRHTDETKHQEAKQPMNDVIHKAYKLLLFMENSGKRNIPQFLQDLLTVGLKI